MRRTARRTRNQTRRTVTRARRTRRKHNRGRPSGRKAAKVRSCRECGVTFRPTPDWPNATFCGDPCPTPRPTPEPPAGKPPRCAVDGCTRRVSTRRNWRNISWWGWDKASPWHHWCERCHAGWLVRDVSATEEARKDWPCDGCGRTIKAGDPYYFITRKKTDLWSEPVSVCVRCRNRYRDLNAE